MSSDIKTFFDAVYLINLKRRRDRLVRFQKIVKEVGGWPLKEWELIEAIDGGSGTVPPPPDWKSGGGAWGCRQSHILIHQKALMAGHEKILILEDDCELREDFIERLTKFLTIVPDDWECLMLGGQNMKEPELIVEGLVRCKNTQRTHALAFRGQAIRDVYQMYCGTNVHIDWRLGPFMGRRRQTYAPQPFIIGQTQGKSDITQRQTPAKFWNEPEQRTEVVFLIAPREVAEHCRQHGCHYGADINSEGRDRGLRKMFPKRGQYTTGVANFVNLIRWEAESFAEAPGIVTVWDPNANKEAYEKVKAQVGKKTFCLIEATTIEEAEKKFMEHDSLKQLFFERKRNTRKPVILLKVSREIRDELDRNDIIHCGYWKDESTGIDNGLIKVFSHKKPNLRGWISLVYLESEHRAALPCVWHPDATVEIVKTTGERVVVVEADSYEEALKQCDAALP